MIQTLFLFMTYKESKMNCVNGRDTSGEYYIGTEKTQKITFKEFIIWLSVWNMFK